MIIPMDLIYKIYSAYLYDGQITSDFFILYNKSKSFIGGNSLDIGYNVNSSLGEIYKIENSKGVINLKFESINLIKEGCKRDNSPLIECLDYVTYVKIGGTHLPNYNAYEIYWNETKSGVNIFDYDLVGTWKIGSSTYTTYRIFEEKNNRIQPYRDYTLNKII
jgi:hypothetical protein